MRLRAQWRASGGNKEAKERRARWGGAGRSREQSWEVRQRTSCDGAVGETSELGLSIGLDHLLIGLGDTSAAACRRRIGTAGSRLGGFWCIQKRGLSASEGVRDRATEGRRIDEGRVTFVSAPEVLVLVGCGCARLTAIDRPTEAACLHNGIFPTRGAHRATERDRRCVVGVGSVWDRSRAPVISAASWAAF